PITRRQKLSTTTTQPKRAKTFIDTIGVNTHISYTDSSLWSNPTDVTSDLNYLGVDEVRDCIIGSAPLSRFVTLAEEGVKFTILVPGGIVTTASLYATFSLIDQLNESVPASVVAVEGPNEINNWPVTYNGVGGLQGAVDLQETVYSHVQSDPKLVGVAVDYFTGYGAGGLDEGPDPATTAGLANYDNQHPYPATGEPPAAYVDPAGALTNETAPYGPAVYTETGYSTETGDNPTGVNQDVQAKYTLNMLMDDAKNGVATTYLYDLLDGYAP